MDNSVARILVVEDNEVAALQLQKVFEKIGYHVDVATNGMDAMEMLMNAKYDMLMTDLSMPHVTGQQLIEAVKRNEYKNLKIFVVTSYTGEATVKETFALGADDYITKPFNVKDLVNRVQKLLASRR